MSPLLGTVTVLGAAALVYFTIPNADSTGGAKVARVASRMVAQEKVLRPLVEELSDALS
jgi:hypothetical protein